MLKQIVVFKGQVFGMDYDHMLFIVHLVPQIRVQKLAIDWKGSMTSKWHLSQKLLVPCEDMILLVGFIDLFHEQGIRLKPPASTYRVNLQIG